MPDERTIEIAIHYIALWVADRASRKRYRPTFVPREWVTEFHAAPKKDPELVA